MAINLQLCIEDNLLDRDIIEHSLHKHEEKADGSYELL